MSVSKSEALTILYTLPISLASFTTALAAICMLDAVTATSLTACFCKLLACVAEASSLLEMLLFFTAKL